MHSEYELRKQKENDGMISDLRAALQGTLICLDLTIKNVLGLLV